VTIQISLKILFGAIDLFQSDPHIPLWNRLYQISLAIRAEIDDDISEKKIQRVFAIPCGHIRGSH